MVDLQAEKLAAEHRDQIGGGRLMLREHLGDTRRAQPLRMCLLEVRGPAAVARFVVSIRLYAIERCARRLLAHVGDEAREAVRPQPSLADRDPSTAVVLPLLGTRIPTARDHPTPRIVGARSRTSAVASGSVTA